MSSAEEPRPSGQFTYRDAGVDIEAGEGFASAVGALARSTHISGVLGGIGGFAAQFALRDQGLEDPVLVTCTDGVGTKLIVAIELDRHGTVGVDLVAMSVNDLVCTGARPVNFLDYLACGKLEAGTALAIVEGVAAGCREAGCALVGGETAEMPGFYPEGHYDLAGFAVGLVERSRIIDGRQVQPGDRILGLHSSGLHSNGYSLVRRLLLEEDRLPLDETPPGLRRTLGEELLEPTRIYVRPVLEALDAGLPIRAMAHITGGGLPGNLLRGFPEGMGAKLWRGSWPEPAIFGLLARDDRVSRKEMLRTFNMGIGFAWVVPPEAVDRARDLCLELGHDATPIGEVTLGPREIVWDEA